jgi:hypothetical protein
MGLHTLVENLYDTHPTKNKQCIGWSLMRWNDLLLANHSVTASCSRCIMALSESLDIKVSTMSSSKGNCGRGSIRFQ